MWKIVLRPVKVEDKALKIKTINCIFLNFVIKSELSFVEESKKDVGK